MHNLLLPHNIQPPLTYPHRDWLRPRKGDRINPGRNKKSLDSVATFPNAVIKYIASDMCLWIKSDTSFASIRNTRSHVGGFFYLSLQTSKIPKNHDPPPNGPIFVLCRTMKMVLSSASEAKYGGIFINSKEGVPICTTLQELGHNQPKTVTPLKKYNSTAHGIVHNNVRQKIALF